MVAANLVAAEQNEQPKPSAVPWDVGIAAKPAALNPGDPTHITADVCTRLCATSKLRGDSNRNTWTDLGTSDTDHQICGSTFWWSHCHRRSSESAAPHAAFAAQFNTQTVSTEPGSAPESLASGLNRRTSKSLDGQRSCDDFDRLFLGEYDVMHQAQEVCGIVPRMDIVLARKRRYELALADLSGPSNFFGTSVVEAVTVPRFVIG